MVVSLPWRNGLEEGDLSEWDSLIENVSGSLRVVEEAHRSGVYGAQVVLPDWANIAKCLKQFTGKLEIFASMYVYFVAWPTDGITNNNIYLMTDPSLLYPAGLGIKNDAGTIKWWFQYRSGGADNHEFLATPSPQLDRWYYIQVKASIDAVNGEARGWIDGTERFSLTGLNNDEGELIEWVSCGISKSGSTGTRETWFDKVTVDENYINPIPATPLKMHTVSL